MILCLQTGKHVEERCYNDGRCVCLPSLMVMLEAAPPVSKPSEFKTEAQIATALKEEARVHLNALTDVMARAKKQGMNLSFQIISDPSYGVPSVVGLTVSKVY